MKVCKRCGFSGDDDMSFCQNCGGVLETIVCPECGKTLKGLAAFCPYCGKKIGLARSAPRLVYTQEKTVEASSQEQSVSASPKDNKIGKFFTNVWELMKKFWKVEAIALLVVIVIVCGIIFVPMIVNANGAVSPERAVRDYYAAIANSDAKGLTSVYYIKDSEQYNTYLAESAGAAVDQLNTENKKVKIIALTVNKGEDYAIASVTISYEKESKAETKTVDIYLENLYGKWYVLTDKTLDSYETKASIVTFDSLGGTEVYPVLVDENETINTSLSIYLPKYDGYKFCGWYKDKELALKYNDADPVTEDMKLYAKWITSDTKYTLTYNVNGGDAITALKIGVGEIPVRVTPTRTGYSFLGWYADSNFTSEYNFDKEIYADFEIFAKWSINSFTVSFETNGASVGVSNQVVEYNKYAAKPANLTKTDYDFIGWFKDAALSEIFNFESEKITTDITIYAGFKIHTNAFTFNCDGGTAITAQDVEVHNAAVKPADPTKDGYDFLGWYADAAFTTEYDWTTVITAPTTVYAKWISLSTQFDVTFNTLGGTAVAAQKVQYKNTVTFPESPTKDGYIFLGWYDSEVGGNSFVFATTRITSNTVIYARWQISYFSFTAIGSTAYAVSEYTGTGGTISVPSSYNGKPVTTINANLLKNNSTVTQITISASVTTIGEDAFNGCSALTSVAFASGSAVTSLGARCFANCAALKDVVFNGSGAGLSIDSTHFSGCTSLENFTVNASGANMTIGANAFKSYTSLKTLTFGSAAQVTSIGASAFYGCTSLSAVTLPATMTTLGDEAFYGCSNLANATFSGTSALTTLGDKVFMNCAKLTSFAVPSGITVLSESTFEGCDKLATIALGSVTEIGKRAFYESGITLIDLTKVTKIGFSSFTGSALTSLTLPTTVTSVGVSAFTRCQSLKSLVINCKNVGDSAFSNCSALTTVSISNLTKITDSMFLNCSSLTSISVPDTVTEIGVSAFSSCSKLSSLTLASGLKTIRANAFADCKMLASSSYRITIPNSVVTVEATIFSGCMRTEGANTYKVQIRTQYGVLTNTYPSTWDANWATISGTTKATVN